MASSVYRVIEVVGTSTESWEDAAQTAVATASGSLRDLRVAEVAQRAGFERGYLVGDLPTTAEQHPLLLTRVGAGTDSLPIFKWVLGRAAAAD